jgi:hypothetical protein
MAMDRWPGDLAGLDVGWRIEKIVIGTAGRSSPIMKTGLRTRQIRKNRGAGTNKMSSAALIRSQVVELVRKWSGGAGHCAASNLGLEITDRRIYAWSTKARILQEATPCAHQRSTSFNWWLRLPVITAAPGRPTPSAQTGG